MLKRFLSITLLSTILALPACASSPEMIVSSDTVKKSAANSQSGSKRAVTHASTPQDQKARFAAWKQDFKARGLQKGYSAALLARVIDPAVINPKALERDKSQPEFTRPIWEYIEGAASNDRISKGKTQLANNRTLFDAIETKYGVPRSILTAIWGLESAYGQIMGTHEIVSALATFAFEGRRVEFGENQLFAILDLIQAGSVRQSQLKGSWAGAMGMTQFIPTTFRDYAVDYDGNGNIDLWLSKGDALGSAANYLSRSGWRAGEPVVAEITLPRGFDYTLSDGRKMSVQNWVARGAAPANGQKFSPQALALQAKLLIPTGGNGPKLLTFKNYDAIKRYNNSTSYALGITTLADSFRGRTTISAPWPKSDLPLSFTNRKRLQESLTRLGYDTKGVDGQIGPNSRRAIRAFQAANQMPADGYATPGLLSRVLKALK